MENVNSLSNPFAENWRKAYRASEKEKPRVSTYQAPKGKPIPFMQDSIGIKGGQAVDTAEFPIFGNWTNNTINNKPIILTLEGFLRGDTYIKDRTELFNSLTITTSDDEPGYVEMPLWGRIPVVLTEWSLDEKAGENGQCRFSLSFVRAGISDVKRMAGIQTETASAAKKADALETAAANALVKELKRTDSEMLARNFTKFTQSLLAITGRVQGAKSTLNALTNKCNSVTNLIAQGIRSPTELAQALIGAVVGICAGVLEIHNAASETASFFSIKNNPQNALRMFLTAHHFQLEEEAITEVQQKTKGESENFYKTISFCAAARLFPEIEMTYQKQRNLWNIFVRLEAAIKKEDPVLFSAIEDVRIAVSQSLIYAHADFELVKEIKSDMPLLAIAHVLGCDEQIIRNLNRIENSFFVTGDVRYV